MTDSRAHLCTLHGKNQSQLNTAARRRVALKERFRWLAATEDKKGYTKFCPFKVS